MRAEIKSKILATELRNGTRSSLSHSKFCINASKEADGFLYASPNRNTPGFNFIYIFFEYFHSV